MQLSVLMAHSLVLYLLLGWAGAQAQVQQQATPPATQREQEQLREQRQLNPPSAGNPASAKPSNRSYDQSQQRRRDQIHKPSTLDAP